MAYEITRNYDTDFSRTDIRTMLANVAHELADEVLGHELPTRTVFEEPELVDEDDNWFKIALRPTVLDAGFTPIELVPSECVRNGEWYIEALGHDGERVDIIVRRPRHGDAPNRKGETVTFEDEKRLRKKVQG